MAIKYTGKWGAVIGRVIGVLVIVAGMLLAASLCMATPHTDNPVPSIFRPHSNLPILSLISRGSFSPSLL